MKEKSLVVLYIRSNLNVILLLVTGALLLNIVIFGYGLQKIFLAVALIVFYLAVSVFFFFSRQGAKQIINEREKERIAKVKEKILQAKQIRDRISFLRIGDDDVRKAIEYVLIHIGNYINKCSEVSNYSPQVNSRIEEILDVCQIYLEKVDQSSLDALFKAGNKDFIDYKERTITLIKDAASFIKNKTDTELIGLTQEERLSVHEDLE